MLLNGSPLHICQCLDIIRVGFEPDAKYEFRPETLTRFAVCDSRGNHSILLSTHARTSLNEGAYAEIGRVGVLLDDRGQGGQSVVLLAVHCPQISSDSALQSHIADISVHIMRGQRTDMMTAPMRDIVRDARVSMYSTSDGGASWMTRDVTHVLQDFLVHDGDMLTVRCGRRATKMTVAELLGYIIEGRPAVDCTGVAVEDDAVLVHFTPPGVSEPVIAAYSPSTDFTAVYGSKGLLAYYEAHNHLILNRRLTDVDAFPFVGIAQSGDQFFGAPLALEDIRSVTA